jgi:hypothetical protein
VKDAKNTLRSLETLAKQDSASRLEAAEATTRSLRLELKRLHRAHGVALEFNDDLLTAIHATDSIGIPEQRPAPKRGSTVAAVFPVSDWHTGERISFEEMDRFNRYDYALQEKRLRFLVESVLRWVDVQRKGYRIDRLYIPVLGDLINGEIHPEEYLSTNEFRTPEQTAKAGHLLAWLITQFVPVFREVIVDCIGADNHARRTTKPSAKEAARNSYNYLVYEIAKAVLAHQKNVRLNFHLPLKAQVEIEGRSVILSHGHETKAWMGIPFYGIERAEGREARKRLSRGRPYTLHIIGHWHAPGMLSGLIINGALCGSTEYDAMAGRYADASQTTFLMHREHGHFNLVPWNLQEV